MAATLSPAARGLSWQAGRGRRPSSPLNYPTPGRRFLTGPSFAADIAKGLPTALTLACRDEATSIALQQRLTAPNLRIYRTRDVVGAELGGGALKNVIATFVARLSARRLVGSSRGAA